MKGFPRKRLIGLGAAALSLGLAGGASAATFNWTGNGGDTNWDTAANWDAAPAFDGTDDLVFGTSFNNGDTSSPNGDRHINSLTINNSAFGEIANSSVITIESGRLTRTDAAGGDDEIVADMELNGPAIWHNSGGGEFRIRGTVTMNNPLMIKTGDGLTSIEDDGVVNGLGQLIVAEGHFQVEGFGGDNEGDRIPDSAQIDLAGGRLSARAAGGGNQGENFGDTFIRSGVSEFGMSQQGNGSPNEMNLASLTRDANLRGNVNITGMTPGSVQRQIFVTGGVSLIGGGGAAGTTNISILPYAMNEDEWITYDAGGFRPLDESTEYYADAGTPSNTLNTAAATDNIRVDASQILTGDRTINSFTGRTGTGGRSFDTDSPGTNRTLTITSGAMRIASFSTTEDVTLAFPGEALINVGTSRNATFEGGLVGSNGLTKWGNGDLFLDMGSLNQLTGQYTVNAGELKIATSDSIPDSVSIRVASGANFGANNGRSETVANVYGSGMVTLGGTTGGSDRTITVGTDAGNLTGGGIHLNGGTLDPGDFIPGTMTLSSNNTGVVMSAGTIKLDFLANELFDVISMVSSNNAATASIFDAVTLDVNFLSGFNPSIGSEFTILNATGLQIVDGDGGDLFGQINFAGLASDAFEVENFGDQVVLRVIADPFATDDAAPAVPEPAAAVMATMALAGLALRRRRA